MSAPLVECVPNFSEGRDAGVLEALAAALRSVPGAGLLDVHADASHHRSVFTLAGRPGAVAEAAYRAARVAVERIDLRRHRGEHPRIGAVDVVPFVPLRGASMELCVELAERTGSRIADELGVPVYLYARAARRPGRERLAGIRAGGFEGLREAVRRDPDRRPDFGPPRLHPGAGATAVGARPILVAYNVLLESGEVEPAKRIARRIRASDGGLPAVQALGFLVDGRAQVSTNLLDVDRTPPLAVFEAVRREAVREGVAVAGSEIVGLVPERALPGGAEERLRLEGPAARHVLERRLEAVLGADGGGAGSGAAGFGADGAEASGDRREAGEPREGEGT